MLDTILRDTKDKMGKAIDTLKKDMTKVRTGRASSSMLDGIKVDYYGTLTSLSQMSSISIPESRLITIQPWDQTAIKEIEKAILKANLGLTPSNDGKIIRINIPPLTEDRRKDIVKQIGKTCEDYRISLRNIRRDANELIKKLKKDSEISEDESFKSQDKVQEELNKFISQVDEVYENKKKEILEF